MEVYVIVETYVTGHGDDEFTIWKVFKSRENALNHKDKLYEKHPDSDFEIIITNLIE